MKHETNDADADVFSVLEHTLPRKHTGLRNDLITLDIGSRNQVDYSIRSRKFGESCESSYQRGSHDLIFACMILPVCLQHLLWHVAEADIDTLTLS